MNIQTGARRVGKGISMDGVRVSGNIRMPAGGGNNAPAKWGEITGDLADQTDLKNALNDKASVSALAEVAEEVAAKASAVELNDLADAVGNKLTTPQGSEGQFMMYREGEWVGETVPSARGVNF